MATPARIDQAAGTSLNAVQKAFKDAFKVDGLPQFVVTDAAVHLTGSMDTIKGSFSDLRQSEQNLAGWVNKGADIKSRALSIIRDPMQLANEVANMINFPLT